MLRIDPGEEESQMELEFQDSLETLFTTLGGLLATKAPDLVTAQAQALKHIPTVIEPLSAVFSERRLRYLHTNSIHSLPKCERRICTFREFIKYSTGMLCAIVFYVCLSVFTITHERVDVE